MNSRLNASLLVAVVVICLSMSGPVEGDILNKINKAADDGVRALSNLCVINDNCYKDFLTLSNYCCLKKAQCCNVFDYIFSGGSVWDNFVETMKNPRPVNIILMLVALLIIGLLLSMLISIIGYFFCGCSRFLCCGERKYSIVNH